MDSNKDEGNKCMQIAKAALEAGDRERAVKFFTKAQRLYPTSEAETFLSSLREGNGKQAADEKTFMKRSDSADLKEEKKGGSSGVRQRNGFHQAGSSTAGGSDASAEQIEIVTRIKRTKDYYQILGVAKDCTEEDVKKAYRKISLKVHPDKNKAAGAEEAFKAVSKAFHCLSDSELRAKYDAYGAEDENDMLNNPIRRRRTAGNPVFYEDIFEPNDVFNTFFFGMQQPQAGFRRAHFTRAAGEARGGRQENNSHNLLGLLQLLPILALFLFSYFPFSQPVYSLDKVAPYQLQQKTKEYGVTYYVKSADFDRDYPLGSHPRRELDSQVERDYKDILIHNCRIERSYRSWGQVRETPHCEKLQRLRRVVVS